METFTNAKPFTIHPGYFSDREKALRELEEEIRSGFIDPPLFPMIRDCIVVNHFFTVQCCFGHFVHDLEPDTENLTPPSQYKGTIEKVRYRLAYFVFCLQNNTWGREMYDDLEKLALNHPDYIQFGSADWFWERMKNTYCIQLEPEQFKLLDSALIGIEEAIFIQMLRNDFFKRLADIIHKHRNNLLDPSKTMFNHF